MARNRAFRSHRQNRDQQQNQQPDSMTPTTREDDQFHAVLSALFFIGLTGMQGTIEERLEKAQELADRVL